MKHAKLCRDLRKERTENMNFTRYMTIILLVLGSAQDAPISELTLHLELQHNCLVCLSW